MIIVVNYNLSWLHTPGVVKGSGNIIEKVNVLISYWTKEREKCDVSILSLLPHLPHQRLQQLTSTMDFQEKVEGLPDGSEFSVTWHRHVTVVFRAPVLSSGSLANQSGLVSFFKDFPRFFNAFGLKVCGWFECWMLLDEICLWRLAMIRITYFLGFIFYFLKLFLLLFVLLLKH